MPVLGPVAELEAQRLAVLAQVQVIRALLPGAPTEAWGRWEGVGSAFNDVYRTFRYLARLRYAGSPADPAPPEVAGLTTELWSPPAGGLLVTVHGEPVELPAGVRRDWTRRSSREELSGP